MNNQAKITLAIAATFTAEPIDESLNFWSRELKIPLRIEFAPYNQVFQQLLYSSSLMYKNNSGMNVILIRFEDWVRMEDSRTGNLLKTSEQEKVEENVKGFLTALSTISEGSATPYLVCICPASQACTSSKQMGHKGIQFNGDFPHHSWIIHRQVSSSACGVRPSFFA